MTAPETVLSSGMSPLIIRLRELRKEKGLTQEELARRAGLRRATISDIENGKTQRVGLTVLQGLADALKIAPASLIGEQAPHLGFGNPGKKRGGRPASKLEQFENIIDLLEHYSESLEELTNIARADPRRDDFTRILRVVRFRLSKVINSMEGKPTMRGK